MAKIKLSSLFEELSGRLGGMIFKRTAVGKSYMSRVPNMSRVKWSKAQKAHRKRFKEAVAYAKEALQDPEMFAHYQELARRQNSKPFNMAVSEYFKVLKKMGEPSSP